MRTPLVRRLPRPILLLFAPLILLWVPAPTVRDAGPVIDLRQALAAPGSGHSAAGHGELLLTSVREEHDPLWLWATRTLFEPRWDPRRTKAGGSVNSMANMQEAKTCAWEVAVKLGLGSASGQSMPVVNTAGMTGPSGGLMLALAFTDALNAGDLTGGRTIAGTGTIADDGTVGDIGYVTYKVRGAAMAGATVFFVPLANFDEARRVAPQSMAVVPVATFGDAVQWLCDVGAADTACHKLPAHPAA